MFTEADLNEESLDPGNWQEFRQVGHRMLDDMLDYLETVRERPVWQPMPDAVKNKFQASLPDEPTDLKDVYQDFQEQVLAYPMGNIHPRFWAFVMGPGTPTGMLADMLAAGLNPNLGGGEHSAAYVEKQVIDWCKQIFDFPGEASGLLVSGGSMANLVGITAARNRRAGYDLREIGLGSSSDQMVMYASNETHSSNIKAVELLGLGRRRLRTIPVDSEYRMKIPSLEEAINQDRKAGLHPVCVIANAGTTNTGAFDDLEVIAEICKRENIWMHVDGAFGAFAKLIPAYQHLTKGIERADSLAFDLHKWMYLPFEVGCVLVRSEEDHRYAFSLTPDYLEHMPRGLAAGKTWFSDYGLQLTRGFRALKVWMSLKENGIRKYARLIEKDIGLAQYLRAAIDASSHLENLAPAPLNIVCFRYNKPGLDQDALNELNKEILFELHERGIAVPSYTTLDEKFALRVSITNHRSRREDIDLFIDAVVRIGDALNAS